MNSKLWYGSTYWKKVGVKKLGKIIKDANLQTLSQKSIKQLLCDVIQFADYDFHIFEKYIGDDYISWNKYIEDNHLNICDFCGYYDARPVWALGYFSNHIDKFEQLMVDVLIYMSESCWENGFDDLLHIFGGGHLDDIVQYDWFQIPILRKSDVDYIMDKFKYTY